MGLQTQFETVEIDALLQIVEDGVYSWISYPVQLVVQVRPVGVSFDSLQKRVRIRTLMPAVRIKKKKFATPLP